jgi:hypothetical protein
VNIKQKYILITNSYNCKEVKSYEKPIELSRAEMFVLYKKVFKRREKRMFSPSRKVWMSAVVRSITAQEVSYESGKRRSAWSWGEPFGLDKSTLETFGLLHSRGHPTATGPKGVDCINFTFIEMNEAP